MLGAACGELGVLAGVGDGVGDRHFAVDGFFNGLDGSVYLLVGGVGAVGVCWDSQGPGLVSGVDSDLDAVGSHVDVDEVHQPVESAGLVGDGADVEDLGDFVGGVA